jgi:hypothetical protein
MQQYFDQIRKNPVFSFAALGAIAGSLLGGSRKEQTNQAFLYGSLGAAAGFFFDKSQKERAKAQAQAVMAQHKAAQAVALATQAKKLISTPAGPKIVGAPYVSPEVATTAGVGVL